MRDKGSGDIDGTEIFHFGSLFKSRREIAENVREYLGADLSGL